MLLQVFSPFLVFFFALNFARVVVSNIFDPNYECSPEDAEIQRANVYFRCKNKRLSAAGCLGLDNVRVPINGTYKAFGNFDMLCKQVSSYWAQLVPLTCWVHNKQYAPDETYVEGRFWYTCVKTNDDLRIVISGCVGENGEKVNPGTIFKMSNFLYTCARMGNSGINLEATGCLHKGTQYLLGQEVVDTTVVWKCTRENGTVFLRQIGCVWHGRRVGIGETYINGGFVVRCQLQGQAVTHSLVGCLSENNVTHEINAKWTEGTAPFRYVVRCTKLPTGAITKELLQCAYDHPEGRAVLKPGCMRRVGASLVRCYSPDVNGIAFRVNSIAEPMIQERAAAEGFKLC